MPLTVRDELAGSSTERVPGAIPITDAAVAGDGSASRDGSGPCGSPRCTTRPPSSSCSSTARGGISVVFLGRRGLAGVDVGTRMVVEGTVGVHKARLALLNPSYQLLPPG